MPWEYDQYIAHHGIKGQKWGVRRYQNADSSLTAEGKARYAKACGDLAEKIYKKASAREPKITRDVVSAVTQSGSRMYGLEHRLKTKESLARKIDADSKEKNISPEEAARSIKDAIRYTSLCNDDLFTDSYHAVRSNLENQGYSEIRCRNYFELYRQGKAKHKQITSVYADKKGNQFELQFQTPSSLEAKNRKTPLYEAARTVGIGEKRKAELTKEMDALAKRVKTPKGVYRIKSHG